MDGICLLNQRAEFLVGIQQSFVVLVFFQVIDVGQGSGVVCTVVAIGLLTDVVKRIAVVCTPAGDVDRLKLRLIDLFGCTGDIGLDIQLYKVITQAVRKSLCQNVCAVQSCLVGAGDVVVNADREGDTDGAQLFHRLFFVLSCFVSIQSDRCFPIFLRQTQFLSNQLGVVGAVGGVQQTRHRVEVIFAAERVDGIGSAEGRSQIQTVVPSQTECLVCDGIVPVGVRCAVFLAFVIVEVKLIGTEIVRPLNHLVVVWIALIAADGLDIALGQTHLVDFAGLIQLVCHVAGFYHLDSDCLKAGAIGIPVQRILGQDLFIALNIGGHGVAAVVPHIFVVHRLDSVYAQLIHQALCQRIQTSVSRYGIKVWFCSRAMVNQSMLVRRFNLDHLAEFGAFSRIECISLFCAQALGIFIIFGSALNHLHRHRGVGRIIFMEVQNPLHCSQKVLRNTFCFFIAVDIHPCCIVTQMEGPGQTAVFGSPLLCNCRNQLTVGVDLQQTIPEVGQILRVSGCFRIEQVEGGKFRGCNLGDNKVGDCFALCNLFGLFFLCRFFSTALAGSRFFVICLCVFSCAGRTAAAQDEGCCQRQCQNSGCCFFHNVPPYVR